MHSLTETLPVDVVLEQPSDACSDLRTLQTEAGGRSRERLREKYAGKAVLAGNLDCFAVDKAAVSHFSLSSLLLLCKPGWLRLAFVHLSVYAVMARTDPPKREERQFFATRSRHNIPDSLVSCGYRRYYMKRELLPCCSTQSMPLHAARTACWRLCMGSAGCDCDCFAHQLPYLMSGMHTHIMYMFRLAHELPYMMNGLGVMPSPTMPSCMISHVYESETLSSCGRALAHARLPSLAFPREKQCNNNRTAQQHGCR